MHELGTPIHVALQNVSRLHLIATTGNIEKEVRDVKKCNYERDGRLLRGRNSRRHAAKINCFSCLSIFELLISAHNVSLDSLLTKATNLLRAKICEHKNTFVTLG